MLVSSSLQCRRGGAGSTSAEAVDLQQVRGGLPHRDDDEAHVRSEPERVKLDVRLERDELSACRGRVRFGNDVLHVDRRLGSVAPEEGDAVPIRQPPVTPGDETAPRRNVGDPEDRRPVREPHDPDVVNRSLIHEGHPRSVGRNLGQDVEARGQELRVRAVRPNRPDAAFLLVERGEDDRGAIRRK